MLSVQPAARQESALTLTQPSAAVSAGSVSSKHLEITWSDGDWFALDLGSSNGTRLNESQVPMMAGEYFWGQGSVVGTTLLGWHQQLLAICCKHI